MKKAWIAVALVSLIPGSISAAPFDTGFTSTGFLDSRSRIVERKVAPEVAQVPESDIEVSEDLRQLLNLGLPKSESGDVDTQKLLNVISLRSRGDGVFISSRDGRVRIYSSRLEELETERPVIRASPFRVSMQNEASGTVCREKVSPDLVASSRQRDSQGGRILSLGGMFANFGRAGTVLEVKAGGYSDKSRNYKLAYEAPLKTYPCDTSDWVWMGSIAVSANEVDTPGFYNDEAVVEFTLAYNQVDNESGTSWRLSLKARSVDQVLGGSTFQEEAQRVLTLSRTRRWGPG